MSVTVIYLGDGVVGGAVVYGIPFTVGEPVTLPEDFPFTGKIVNNSTFKVVPDAPVVAAPPVLKTKVKPGRAR